MRRKFLIPLVLVLVSASCSLPDGERSGQIKAVASFYPLAFVTQEVGGDLVDVENLTPPGAEPHDLELSPGRVTSLNRADLIVYLGNGFQPSVEEALPELEAEILDALSGQEGLQTAEPHGGEEAAEEPEGQFDPHIWLDPQRTAKIAELVAERLAKIDSDNASAYRERARALESKFNVLDREFKDGLANCPRRNLVTSHEAFGYLASAYDLEQVGIAGLDPEQEPTPQRLAEVADFVKRNGVTTIYFETLVSPALAETLATETGVNTAKLDPLEGPPQEGDYFTAMRTNLKELREGLGCS